MRILCGITMAVVLVVGVGGIFQPRRSNLIPFRWTGLR